MALNLRRRHFSLALLSPLLCACQENDRAPSLDPIADQLVAVGEQLTVMLRATDPDGDELSYGFESSIEHLGQSATVTRRPDGTAVFRWTPLGGDVGSWFIDFTVSDGTYNDTVTALIEVQPLLGEGTAPVFREPLGSGITLDLSRNQCVEIPILVQDLDDAEVTITAEEPVIDGSELVLESGLTGRWRWCPQKHQLGQERHVLRLAADDHRNPKVTKEYLIVLRSASGENCPGEPPQIEHTTQDWSTLIDLNISARIKDDIGLKHEPIVYFSGTKPELPLDFATLDLVTMQLSSGDVRDGTWTATLPNPVANGAEGDSAPLYYVISAGDNDDAEGDCDHLVEAPKDGFFTVTVTHPGGSGALEICEPCSADAQCGAATDLCLPADATAVCGQSCVTSDDCPSGFACITRTSIDGVEAKQCVDADGSCSGEPSCQDDDFEENDSRAQASNKPSLAPGAYEGLHSCGGDDDWYKIQVAQQSTVGAVLEGGAASNLNLGLYDSAGIPVQLSEQATSSEAVEACVAAGTYYVRAYALASADNQYDLLVDVDAGDCAPECVDDDLEENDSLSQAVYADIYPTPYTVSGRAICSADDDWYEVELYTDETLIVDLTFTQQNASQDLDLHFVNAAGVDLTPCSEEEPGLCTTEQGQSGTSNEHYEHTVTTAECFPCTFYVVVRGWALSENSYDLSLALESTIGGF